MLLPGPSSVGCRIGLGDGLEAAICEADCVRLVDRNAFADDLGDEVIAGADDPDVSSLVDDGGATGVQEAGGFLEAC